VAYQVFGEGAQDLVYFYGSAAHIDMYWDAPASRPFLVRLASFARVIMFNRRGTGASQGAPSDATPSWEDWADDLLAVLDAAGSERTAVFATQDGGPIAILFAAMHPARVTHLILQNTTARYLVEDNYPAGRSSQRAATVVETIAALWGTPELLRLVNPSMADEQDFLEFGARWFRASATPQAAAAQMDYMLRSLDVRQALPLVQAPTLVVHARDSLLFPVEQGRHLAANINGARFVELAGGDMGITPENYCVADEVAQFVTGDRPETDIDRIFTTVVFSDIVASTELATSLGDSRWRHLLDTHDRIIRKQIGRFRGREIKTTGDGFLASFDGPTRAIQYASAIIKHTQELGVQLRAGLHTGECRMRGNDLAGATVHIAARLAALAHPNEILVSPSVVDLTTGAGVHFEPRGQHELKGLPGTWHTFSANSRP
jgi:class 3 adenylate cyclase